MKKALKDKLLQASEKDPSLLTAKEDMEKTLGHNPAYLEEILSICKSDLIRLERLGFAIKARYQVSKTGEHRVRWIILKEVLNDL